MSNGIVSNGSINEQVKNELMQQEERLTSQNVQENENVAEQAASVNEQKDFVKMEKVLQVLSLAVLQSKGVKIARLEGNRDLNEKAVKAKMKSMKQYGQLVPAIIVDAATARKQGLKVVDFSTGEEVTEQNEAFYVVLLDANHRYEAHLRLMAANDKVKEEADKYTGEFYLVYSLCPAVAIDKALAEINIATTPWKGADFVKGAKMMVDVELPVLDAIAEATSEGMSLDAASKVFLLNGKVNKTVLVKAINGSIDECLLNTSGLERGRRILEAAKSSFGSDFIKTRNWIDWVISIYENTDDADKGQFTDDMVSFLASIKREDAEPLEKAKGKRGGQSKDTIINEGLNSLWGKRRKAVLAA